MAELIGAVWRKSSRSEWLRSGRVGLVLRGVGQDVAVHGRCTVALDNPVSRDSGLRVFGLLRDSVYGLGAAGDHFDSEEEPGRAGVTRPGTTRRHAFRPHREVRDTATADIDAAVGSDLFGFVAVTGEPENHPHHQQCVFGVCGGRGRQHSLRAQLVPVVLVGCRHTRDVVQGHVRRHRLLVVDWVSPRDGRTEGVMFVFEGGRLGAERTGEIRLPADELRSWAWCTPDEAAARLSPLLARRVVVACVAAGDLTTVYLEDGVPVG